MIKAKKIAYRRCVAASCRGVRQGAAKKEWTYSKELCARGPLRSAKAPGRKAAIAGNREKVGAIREKEGHKNKYTIVEEKNGWGRLKSGAGWISLEFCKKAS